MRADAHQLPFAAASFDAVVAAFIHTDVDDWNLVLRESARVLRPSGRFVYVGTHPCFVGPFSRYVADGPPRLFGGYRRTERAFAGPGIGPGLRPHIIKPPIITAAVAEPGMPSDSIGKSALVPAA